MSERDVIEARERLADEPSQNGRDLKATDEKIEELLRERNAYREAATVSEQNELILFRQLSAYQQQELEQLRAEVQMHRRRESEREEGADA